MTVYYLDHENGVYISPSKTKKYSKLADKAGYEYMIATQKEGKRFIKINSYSEDGEDVFIELTEDMISAFRSVERREQYVADSKKESGIIDISIYAMEGRGDDFDLISGEELIADPYEDTEEKALIDLDKEILRKALSILNPDEMNIIYALYLSKEPISERELSRLLGIPRKTLSYRKEKIFEKIKEFFAHFQKKCGIQGEDGF